jgi:hypothetical protein
MKTLVLTALLLLVFAPAAAATQAVIDDAPVLVAFTEAESEEGDEPAPTTTMVSEGGIEPAELAPPADESEPEDQWTARFLAPTVALLGILGVVAALALYGVRLRAKYRVVE